MNQNPLVKNIATGKDPHTYYFIDTETTALSASKGAVLEVYAEVVYDGRVVGRSHEDYKARPDALIEQQALDVNLIDIVKRQQSDCKTLEQDTVRYGGLFSKLHDYNGDVAVVGWNVKFDMDHLSQSFKRGGDEELAFAIGNAKFIDMRKVAIAWFKKFGGGNRPDNFKLTTVVKYMGIDTYHMAGAHTARGDVERVRAVLNELNSKTPALWKRLKWWWRRTLLRDEP